MNKLVLALMFVFSSAGSSAKAQAPPKEQESLPIIDVHTHTGGFDGKVNKISGIPATREQYFKEWREAGIVGTVVHTHGHMPPYLGPPSAPYYDYVDLKDRNIIQCAGIGDEFDKKEIESALKSGKFGCIKVYLGYVHRYAYDAKYTDVYRLAEKYDVPVVFHTGDTDNRRAKLKYADPLTIDEVAVDHPKVNFVIAHCGNPWIESAAEVAYKNKNVFLECSALLVGKIDEMPKEKVDEYAVRPIAWIFGYVEDPKKLMFGTDWPNVSMKSYVDIYKRAIPKEYWRDVFYENAVRVFKFKAQPAAAAQNNVPKETRQ